MVENNVHAEGTLEICRDGGKFFDKRVCVGGMPMSVEEVP